MSTDALLRAEQEHHQKAFEQYYALGNSRTYAQVAETMHVSTAAVKLWGRAFNWQRRTRERDLKASRELADRTLQAARTNRERRRKVIELALIKLSRAIAEDRIKLRVTDLDRLIRLEQYLEDCEGNRRPETAEEWADLIFDWGEQKFQEIVELVCQRARNEAAGEKKPALK